MLVSVVIPCFNVESFIVECVESVISQTHIDVEIICVDNNSTDDTWTSLLKLKNKYPNIILSKEIKRGANAARNNGLNLAKGNWIQFLDADDLINTSKIKHQLNLVQSSKISASFVAGAYIKKFIDGQERVVNVSANDRFVSPFINQCGITSSNLWNKNYLFQVGSWDEELSSSQESDLMLRLVLNNYNYILDFEPLTIIRERESGQISQGNPQKKWQQYINIRLKFLVELKKCNLNNYLKYQGLYFDFLMVSVLTLAKYDKKTAIQIYNGSIKNEWQSSGNYGFNKIKVAIIKFIGLNKFLLLVKK